MYRSLRNGYCPKGLNSKKINKRLTKFYKPMRGTIWSGSAIEIFKVSYANYYMANIEFGYGGKYTIKAPEGLHIL